MGRAKKQAQHELRQTQPCPKILLRQEHYDEGAWEKVRVQVRLPRTCTSDSTDDGGPYLQVPVRSVHVRVSSQSEAELRRCPHWNTIHDGQHISSPYLLLDQSECQLVFEHCSSVHAYDAAPSRSRHIAYWIVSALCMTSVWRVARLVASVGDQIRMDCARCYMNVQRYDDLQDVLYSTKLYSERKNG